MNPGSAHPRDEKIPTEWVGGLSEFKAWVIGIIRKVLVFVALLGLAFLAVGALALWNTRAIDQKSRERSTQLNQLEESQRQAVCALVLGSIQRDAHDRRPISPLVIQFGEDYHCTPPVVPPPGVGG